ncbi:solute-binding protein [bacterium]|nr:solute-binding protein [bacterium]NIN93188.1 solute-binding protein [bacterium]NIO18985.1 solute-binding protein [bacterium]NIO74114.1 solute-binding protein [bacterium]
MAVSYLIFSGIILILAGRGKRPQLTLATTTSVQDSGLLDALIPPFETENKCRVKVIAVGTGQAIRLAEEGNVDIILVHAPAQEEMFVEEGYGVRRYSIMYNYFAIVGPEEDAAGIKGERKGVKALKKIAVSESTFISRGDDSGTHRKERELWSAAGVEPSGGWYTEAGTGMVGTLRIANERRAYTLTDRGTYLAHRKELDLTILVEEDENLYNPYSIIPVSKEKYPHINYQLVMKFVEFITGVKGQNIIRAYGEKEYGVPLFFPLAISGLSEDK